MAETTGWTAQGVRLNESRKLEQIDQLLRGVALTYGNQQRSISSGRHSRLGTTGSLQGQYHAAGLSHGAGEGATQASGQSPRPRSMSVGRRVQDMHDLVHVMAEISNAGQEIRNMTRRSSDMQGGPPISLRRGTGGSSNGDARGSTGSIPSGAGGGGGGGAAAMAAANSRNCAAAGSTGTGGGTGVAGGSSSGSVAGGLRGTSAGGGGTSSVSGKGVTRSILGGVESLTSKLQLLGGRLTPRKSEAGSPRADRQCDKSSGRQGRNLSSSGDGPNFRDMLAELNAGLLQQGHGLLDTVQGSRDQRPMAPNGVSIAQAGRAAFEPSSMRATATAGVAAALYGNTVAADLAASLILANHQQRAEDVMATDRLLESLHAQIRGASTGSGGGGSGPGTAMAAAVPAPPSQADATSRSGSTSRRRHVGPNPTGGAMMQSFLASLGEAMPLPHTPVIHAPVPAVDLESARPVAPAHPSLLQHQHQNGALGGPSSQPSNTRVAAANSSAASSPVSATAGMTRSNHPQQQAQPPSQPQPPPQQRGDLPHRQKQQLRLHHHQHLQQHPNPPHPPRHERQSLSGFAGPADPVASNHPLPQQQPLAQEHSNAGSVSISTGDIDANFDQRLMDLQRLALNIARSGLASSEVELSFGSGVDAPERRGDQRGEAQAPGVVAAVTSRNASRRDGTDPASLAPRAAWTEDGVAATASVAGAVAGAGGVSSWAASMAGAVQGNVRVDGKATMRPSGGQKSSGGATADVSVGVGAGNNPSVHHSSESMMAQSQMASLALQQPLVGVGGLGQSLPEDRQGFDGLHMALLLQQRRKEKARREEQGAAEAAAATSRARKDSTDLQKQHDALMVRYLAERQRIESLETELERMSREGCSNCTRRRDQLQHLSDVAANSAAQLRELQSQLQEGRTREEVMRRQLEHTAAAMTEQASTGARQRTTIELALQECLSLLETAVAPELGASRSCDGSSGSSSSAAAPSVSVVRPGGLPPGDVEALLGELRTRLREQADMSRRQREMLEAAESKLAEERAARAAAREAASSERAAALALASQQATFHKERAEALQDELIRQRDLMTKLEIRSRQTDDERERIVRQRDAAELSLQTQQAQLEAAQQQQETLVERLYDGQRAREDAEVLQAQIRSLSRQLEEARAAAAHVEALEHQAAMEREAREELDAKLVAVQSQLGEREGALDASRRRIRELESATNSAVASRQVAVEEFSSRSEEVRTLTTENARMFHLLDRLQQEKRAAEVEVQRLAAQVLSAQQELAALREQLASMKEQLAAAKESAVVRDATLAQHQATADVAAARAEACALRSAHEAASEYAQAMARTLRKHGLTPPPPPSHADVTSQIGDLQSRLSAESTSLSSVRLEAVELRQQLADRRSDIEKLKRECQTLTERYTQLEAAHAASQASWQHSAGEDAVALHSLTTERDALQLQLHQMQLAGNQDADELRRKLNRLEVQVESLAGSKREAEERVRALTADLGALRKALGDKEAQMEAMKLALEDAKAAASQSAQMQMQAEVQVAQSERARLAAVAEAEKARAAAEVERSRAVATVEAEIGKARDEAARAAAAAAEAATRGRAAAAEAALAARASAEADREAQTSELVKMKAEVDHLEKELEARNAEYAGLYDYCGQVIGERDAALEQHEVFSAASAAAALEVAALRRELEEVREELSDKEQRLAVKPKMAELQYRINELTAQLTDITVERDAALTENNQLSQKLQEETEAHFQTDGRRVRLGEEVERLRGILKMYSIPF